MLRKIAVCLMACVVLTHAHFALAQNQTQDQKEPPVGTILAVEGEGNMIMRAAESGKAYTARINDVIYRNDVLQTAPATAKGGETRLLLVLLDNSRFTLGESARLRVDEYGYDDHDKAANIARYSALEGAFLYTSGLMAKEDNPDIKIATPYGSIVIRGTSLWGGNLGEQYGIYVDDGEASFESKRGHIRVTAGNATTISNITAIPARPKTLTPEILAAVRQTVALKDTDKIKLRMAETDKSHPAMIAAHSQYTHSARLLQADKKESVRSQNRGVMKIEQDRQDERKKLWNAANPEAANPMLDKPVTETSTPDAAPAETATTTVTPVAPAEIAAPSAPKAPSAPTIAAPEVTAPAPSGPDAAPKSNNGF